MTNTVGNGIVKRKKSEQTEDDSLVGYARVSTVEQNLDMQITALKRAGVADRRLHVEKVSASSKRRPMLDWAIETLRPGQTLVVWKLDRIARSMQDMLNRMEKIKSAGAGFKSLTEQLDTNTPGGVFLFHMLSAAAQLERDLVVQRTRAGVAAAKERGVVFGQPSKLDKKQQAQVRKWRKERHTVRVIQAMVREQFGIEVSHALVHKYSAGLGRRRKPNKT